jgi:hypothetical protein
MASVPGVLDRILSRPPPSLLPRALAGRCHGAGFAHGPCRTSMPAGDAPRHGGAGRSGMGRKVVRGDTEGPRWDIQQPRVRAARSKVRCAGRPRASCLLVPTGLRTHRIAGSLVVRQNAPSLLARGPPFVSLGHKPIQECCSATRDMEKFATLSGDGRLRQVAIRSV